MWLCERVCIMYVVHTLLLVCEAKSARNFVFDSGGDIVYRSVYKWCQITLPLVRRIVVKDTTGLNSFRLYFLYLVNIERTLNSRSFTLR